MRPRGFQALLGDFVLVGGGGVSIHNMHALNTVCTLRPEVSGKEIPLQISILLQMGPFEIILTYMHGTTCVDFWVVTYVRGGEGLA